MATKIKDVLDIEAELIEGSGGVFDVRADGKLGFSKDEVGRFPTAEEVLDLLQA